MNDIEAAHLMIDDYRLTNGLTIKAEGPGFKILDLPVGTPYPVNEYPVFLLKIRIIFYAGRDYMNTDTLMNQESAQIIDMLAQSPHHMWRVFPAKHQYLHRKVPLYYVI